MKRYRLLSAALLVSMAGCSIPKLEIYAGSATDSIAGELRSDSSQDVTGTTLDMEGDLGVSENNYPFNARLAFAVSRSILDITYSRRSLSSTSPSMVVTNFGDVTLDVETMDLELEDLPFVDQQFAVAGWFVLHAGSGLSVQPERRANQE